VKNQYVGDVNDYLKYGLLRALQTVRSDPLYVCWMLTPDDSGPDGRKLTYLKAAGEYRKVDPQLFDVMDGLIQRDQRSVAAVEQASLFPRATYFSAEIPVNASDRRNVIQQAVRSCPKRALVFFDPDNGLEGKTDSRGRVKSNKFVFWDELRGLIDPSRSAVIYQHNGRPKGGLDAHYDRLLQRLESELLEHASFALRGPNVAFLFAVREDETPILEAAASQFCTAWPKRLWMQGR
jgi:ferredoxin